MKLWDTITLAGTFLTRRRLRAFLCALSVGVGVGAMVLIAALGAYGQREVQRRVDGLGLGGLAVYLSEAKVGEQLQKRHAELLERTIPEVQNAMVVKAAAGSYRGAQDNGNAVFFGVTEALGDVMHLEVVEGRLPSARQIENGELVAVVDRGFAQQLYGRENIVGKRLRFTIDGIEQYYRVVGVIRQQTDVLGAALGSVVPSIIYVPYTCLTGSNDGADQIMVQCIAGADTEQVRGRIKACLGGNGQVSGTLAVQDMGGMLGQIEGAVGIATLLFLLVAAISFFVSMLGVLSGMLSAAHEKRAEIGLFMALGARKRDIARLFLAQAILISVVGGMAGLLFSALILLGIGGVLHLSLAVPPMFAVGALALSALCGALAGAIPAVHAAGLQPAEAMRK